MIQGKRTAKYDRGRKQSRAVAIILVLLDGRSHSLDALYTIGREHGICEKTIRRDMDNLLCVEALYLRKFSYNGKVYFRSEAVIGRRQLAPAFKKCSYCQNKKPCNKQNFHKQSTSPDGFRAMCIPCQLEYNRVWRESNAYNPEQQKIYRQRWVAKKRAAAARGVA